MTDRQTPDQLHPMNGGEVKMAVISPPLALRLLEAVGEHLVICKLTKARQEILELLQFAL